MQHDIEQIRALCDTFRTEKKLLIIPGASIRAQLLKTLGDYGVHPLNLCVRTVRELAYEIAEFDILAAGLVVLDGNDVADVMSDILRSLRDNGALGFFNVIEITSGICKALARTVLELLGWGFSTDR